MLDSKSIMITIDSMKDPKDLYANKYLNTIFAKNRIVRIEEKNKIFANYFLEMRLYQDIGVDRIRRFFPFFSLKQVCSISRVNPELSSNIQKFICHWVHFITLSIF